MKPTKVLPLAPPYYADGAHPILSETCVLALMMLAGQLMCFFFKKKKKKMAFPKGPLERNCLVFLLASGCGKAKVLPTAL